ncbi:pseudouridine synthase [Clostridium vincentii]|uniref:Pseudouridine synthase n=1 Tax=Clostridium vincentii TaxID=52704 RepID=A0A2T0B8M6_9CLOT|nr:pseudouridine synthase [Clostridium vincentii]PRR80212.1 Ribosomal large subunit pseudouridine synthase F [Clostridium vincentii]
MRINKLLSNYGYCSRKETNELIDSGRITIKGLPATPGQWVEETDLILLDYEPIKRKASIYLILNKPMGITCTADESVENNIIEFLNYPEYIFPVGRLDKESQGLIILTNDGELANKILESDNGHEKEYVVTLSKPYDEKFLENMARGVEIGDKKTKPSTLKKISEDTFSIILTQGLNKQIRKMSRAFGYNVVRLERIRIMNIKLEGLIYGKWREITEDELKELRSLCNKT